MVERAKDKCVMNSGPVRTLVGIFPNLTHLGFACDVREFAIGPHGYGVVSDEIASLLSEGGKSSFSVDLLCYQFSQLEKETVKLRLISNIQLNSRLRGIEMVDFFNVCFNSLNDLLIKKVVPKLFPLLEFCGFLGFLVSY